ncbi:unnamed protein product [Mytilus edulis]|uniref:Reverse transcriptase zinc-binding domain-containing protein n=1 Tax=Mytilus edulis TaxID=6550 RepID=A0A8S3RWU4_MYTED|nr:unnamed protein product [Mytilus edulis]
MYDKAVSGPTAYKIFINSLLQTFERNQLGACIRPIYCGIPTVADDVALISTDPYELQTMLNVQADHANRLRYLLRRIPIEEGEIHKKILKTFGNIIRNDKTVEREIAFRQLAMKDENSGKTVHNIWKSSGTDPYSVNMAAIKVKIATGIMILQYQRSRFSKNCISANCPLCNIEPEDTTHFILKCEKLSSIRNRFIQELKSFLVDCNKPSLLIQELFDDEENLLHLIIDCISYHFLTYKEQVRIETLTRGLCYKLYHKRLLLMSE